MEAEQKSYRKYSPETKFKIVKEALTTDSTVSQITQKYDITSSLFYRWQDQFMAAALDGFRHSKEGPTKAELRKIDSLEKDMSRMKNVIAEITAENIELKKSLPDL